LTIFQCPYLYGIGTVPLDLASWFLICLIDAIAKTDVNEYKVVFNYMDRLMKKTLLILSLIVTVIIIIHMSINAKKFISFYTLL
jgi:hypothetical protein